MKVKATPMFNTKLHCKKKISDLKVGEVAYTVPWAFDPDTNELETDFPIFTEPGGTVQLMVERAQNDWGVYLLDKTYEW
jgi:hypothetical protein